MINILKYFVNYFIQIFIYIHFFIIYIIGRFCLKALLVFSSKIDVNSNVMPQFIVVNVSTFIKFYANKIFTLHSL